MKDDALTALNGYYEELAEQPVPLPAISPSPQVRTWKWLLLAAAVATIAVSYLYWCSARVPDPTKVKPVQIGGRTG